MSGKAFTVTVVTVLVVAAALIVWTLTVGEPGRKQQQKETCSALNARVASTGSGHFLCIDSGGRVVGP
jgi:hypothetical protein